MPSQTRTRDGSGPYVDPVSHFPTTSSLDGLYLWLGPTGAASHVDGVWDSTVGGDLAIVRVREAAPVSVVGGSLGASRWSARGGGRVWLDAIAATGVAGHPIGVTLGPLVELSDVTHPKFGGSIGLWGFAGVAPFVRVGYVEGLGTFAEVGLHIALPVWRR